MFFLIVLGLVTLIGIIYMAMSRKSSFTIRIAALGALALMIITVIVCLILFFRGAADATQFILLPDADVSDIPPPSGNNTMTMVMFIFFLIALFVMILVLSLREHKRSGIKEVEDKTFGEKW